MTHPDFQSP